MLFDDCSLMRLHVRMLLLHEAPILPMHLEAVWCRWNVLIVREGELLLKLIRWALRIHRLLNGRLVHWLPIVCIARSHMFFPMLSVMMLALRIHLLRQCKLTVPSEIMRRRPRPCINVANVLEWCARVRDMLLLHLSIEVSSISYVVQVYVPKLEQIAEVVQIVRHSCHGFEIGRVVHAGRIGPARA